MLTEPATIDTNNDPLRLSRRLDWRFMFADPGLTRVIVAGEPDSELIHALEQFSDHVLAWQGRSVESCDMLVMHDPSFSLFRDALKALQPERFHVEFDGKGLKERWQRFLCLVYMAFLNRWEFRRFWYWPDITNANRIIPLFRLEPMAFVIAKGENDVRTRWKIAALDIFRRTIFFSLLVNGLSIAGERWS
jgi:hypothetical protein